MLTSLGNLHTCVLGLPSCFYRGCIKFLVPALKGRRIVALFCEGGGGWVCDAGSLPFRRDGCLVHLRGVVGGVR